MNVSLEEVKGLLLTLLDHDRWNSALSDDRLAEKIAITLSGRGLIEPHAEKPAPPPARA